MNASNIHKVRVTWVRWDPKRREDRSSEVWKWLWTDPEGYERYYDSKREALTARHEYELAS